MKETVVIGFLGPTLDRGYSDKRWDMWRPTVAICMQKELKVSKFILLHDGNFEDLRNLVSLDIRSVSPHTEIIPQLITVKDPWNFESVYAELFDFAKNYPFDPDKEDYLINITTGTHVEQICLFLLTESRHLPGSLLQAHRIGHDPVGRLAVINLDLKRYDQIIDRFAVETSDSVAYLKSGIDTKSAVFNSMMEDLTRVCESSDDPILLTGPSGSGKTRLARLIFQLKKKKHKVKGKFVELNCATIRGSAAVSALFGHVKGSYTGAVKDRAGLLCEADSGLLFLDEIGELGADEQAMLLRAVEEKHFYPLGSDTEVTSDFQLICGTNRDLKKMVAEGKFREDLLARINLWTFRLPGLKDRPEDIAPNLDFEIEKAAERLNRRIRFNAGAKEKFLELAQSDKAVWKSNFRDLSGAVTRMAVLSDNGRITDDTVDREWNRLLESWDMNQSASKEASLLEAVLGEKAKEIDPFDAVQLEYVIKVCRESSTLSEAGRKLFACSRSQRQTKNDSDRLRKYLAKFGLDWA